MGTELGTKPPLRALIVIRLSRVTEATTSPERQLKACRKLCEERGYEVVDVAEDPDVSAGATTPFDRPDLGPWLRNRHHEYDVIVVRSMDRLVRRLFDLADMIRWAQQHDVAIVSVSEPFLDLTQPHGEMMAMFVANAAQLELEAISSRNASAARHLIRSGRWRGGTPPWGYRPKKDGKEWRLVQDPEQVEVILDVVRQVLEDKTPLRTVARDLTAAGVLTPRDRYAQIMNKPVRGHAWHSAGLRRGLTSPTLMGRIVTRDPVLDSQGKSARDAKGNRVLGEPYVVLGENHLPVVRAEPVLDRKTFDRLVAELEGRENRKEVGTRARALLNGVLFCGVCGQPGYRLKGGEGRKARYRCKSVQGATPCGNGSILLEWADTEVTTATVGRLGHMERRQRTWVAGSDVGAELAEVNEKLADLTDLLGSRVYKRGTPQRSTLDANIAALAERQEALQAIPTVPSGWSYEPTGETVAQWWERVDVTTRTRWLRETGVKASWVAVPEGGRTRLDSFEVDLGQPDLDSDVLPGSVAAVAGSDDPLRQWLAQHWWEQGGAAHEGVVEMDDPGPA